MVGGCDQAGGMCLRDCVVFVCGAVCQIACAAVFVVSCGGGQWDGSRQHHTDSYSTST